MSQRLLSTFMVMSLIITSSLYADTSNYNTNTSSTIENSPASSIHTQLPPSETLLPVIIASLSIYFSEKISDNLIDAVSPKTCPLILTVSCALLLTGYGIKKLKDYFYIDSKWFDKKKGKHLYTIDKKTSLLLLPLAIAQRFTQNSI